MSNLFIKRLTDEQVKTFLEREFPKKEKYSYSFFRDKEHIYVNIDRNSGDWIFNSTLREYDTIGNISHCSWVNYLYKVFGEEYKKAYLKNCEEIFDWSLVSFANK